MIYHFLRLYHTVKYLRFQQVWFRLFYRFKPVSIKKLSTPTSKDWSWSGPKVLSQSLWPNWEAEFLSRRESLESNLIWNDSSMDKLWLYNLHYFDDLNSFGAENREEFHLQCIDRWIAENPPNDGNGWEPYPLSLRLVNWIKWFSQKKDIDEKYLMSMLQQANVLSQKLEYHILGNHLFANAKALIFVGSFLDDKNTKYLQIGLTILDRELREQLLDDGAHFELSPMYHTILLWDLLDLINLATITQLSSLNSRLKQWQSLAEKALGWLHVMVHPDNDISFFNDAAFAIAPNPRKVFEYAQQLGLNHNYKSLPLVTLPSSGYSRINQDEYTLFVDHANIGPDYLPGHAHADNLSFELSVSQIRVFVNSGTSLYGSSHERLRQRGTEAHNTVSIEGKNSSEVWSGFRVARRAYSTLHSAAYVDDETIIDASHDGYKRLPSKNIHRRCFKSEKSQVTIEDSLSGKPVNAVAHFHIHPQVAVSIHNQHTIELLTPNKSHKLTVLFSNEVTVAKSTWHPKFGLSVANSKLIAPLKNNTLTTTIKIERLS